MRDYKDKWWTNEQEARHRSWFQSLLVIAVLALVAWGMVALFYEAVDKTMQIEEQNNGPHRQERAAIMKGDQLEAAFEKNGSPVPKQMAAACRATKSPKTMAAIAIVESNGTPWAKGKAGERGAWQVIDKHWPHGPVPKHPVNQALQAEKILDELVAASPRGSLRLALARYNGGDKPPAQSWRYAEKVLKVRTQLGDV